MIKLPKVIPAPTLPDNLDQNAKWLSGEGAGSWFVFEESPVKNQFAISRYSPEGRLECKGEFISDSAINIHQEFKVDYPSHCQKITILQNNNRFTLLNTRY